MGFIEAQTTEEQINRQVSLLSNLVYDGEYEVDNTLVSQIQSDFSFSAASFDNIEKDYQNGQGMFGNKYAIVKGDSVNSLAFTNCLSSIFEKKEKKVEENVIKVEDSLHCHNLRPKRGCKRVLSSTTNISEVEDPTSVTERKKRPYFRKNKHPREVLERVEAERLKRKRAKNRELAAKSRKKRKERMGFLEKEYDRLTVENKALKIENANLKRRFA